MGNVTPIISREQSRKFAIDQQKRELMQLLGFPEKEAEEMAQHWIDNEQRGDVSDE